MKKLIMVLITVGSLINYTSANADYDNNKIQEEDSTWNIIKGTTYLGVSACTAYIAYNSYLISKGQPSDSTITKKIILYFMKHYDKLAQAARNKAARGRKFDPNYIPFVDDIINAVKDTKQDLEAYESIATTLSIASGLTSVFFGALGIKNMLKGIGITKA